MNVSLNKIIIYIFIIFAVAPFFNVVLAAPVATPAPTQTYQLLTPIPGDKNTTMESIDTSDPLSYIQGLFKIFVAVAIALSVIVLAYGGITYMTSDAITLKSKGKEIIRRSLWGLLLLLTSYLIVSTINPNALNLERLFQTKAVTPGTDYNSGNPVPGDNGDSNSSGGDF